MKEDGDNLLAHLAARQRGTKNSKISLKIFKKVLLGRHFQHAPKPFEATTGKVIEAAGRLLLVGQEQQRVPVHPVPGSPPDDIDISILDSRHSLSPSQYRIPRSHGKSYDAFLLATNTESLQKVWSHPCRARVEAWQVDTGHRPFPHNPWLFLLRADNRLEHIDLVTGKLFKSFFLSRQFRYTGLSIDAERGWLVLSSVKNGGGRAPHLGCKSSDVLKSLLILSTPHLETVAHFKICKSVFGSDVSEVEVISGLLLVMRSNKMMEAYDFDEALSLSSSIPPLSPSSLETGRAATHSLTKLPPILWQVKSEHHHLEFQENPWLYIRSRSAGKGTGDVLCLHQIGNHEPVEFGEFGIDPVERDQVSFHPDDSARVIHSGSSGFKVYSLEGDEDDNLFLEQRLSCRAPKQQEVRQLEQREDDQSLRRGRRARTQVSTYRQEQEELRDVSFCYEDELNILATVHSKETVDEEGWLLTTISEARFYDNTTLRLLKIVPLDIVSVRSTQDVQGSVSINLDLDVLTISVKSRARTRVWVLRLDDPTAEDKERQQPSTTSVRDYLELHF